MAFISISGLAAQQSEALLIKLDLLFEQQWRILHNQEQLMAKLTDVNAAIGRLKDAVVKEIGEVKAKIAGGGAATEADLDSVVAALDKATADIDTISEGGAASEPATT